MEVPWLGIVAAVLFGMVIAGALNLTPEVEADRPDEDGPEEAGLSDDQEDDDGEEQAAADKPSGEPPAARKKKAANKKRKNLAGSSVVRDRSKRTKETQEGKK